MAGISNVQLLGLPGRQGGRHLGCKALIDARRPNRSVVFRRSGGRSQGVSDDLEGGKSGSRRLGKMGGRLLGMNGGEADWVEGAAGDIAGGVGGGAGHRRGREQGTTRRRRKVAQYELTLSHGWSCARRGIVAAADSGQHFPEIRWHRYAVSRRLGRRRQIFFSEEPHCFAPLSSPCFVPHRRRQPFETQLWQASSFIDAHSAHYDWGKT